MMKKLLHILDEDPNYTSFHLDGQSIVLNDYLEIHPEDLEKLKKYISTGRVKVGPWYVQPDEALVSGESLIRNFARGIRIAESFGGSQRIGYLPDMFGHISQMPQILDGFDIRDATLWRGLGDRVDGDSAEMIWEGADGSPVLAYRFSHEYGYSELFRLNRDPQAAANQIRHAVERHLAPSSATHILLLMIGVDHMEPQDDFTEVLNQAAQLIPEFEIIHSSINAFMQEVREKVDRSGITLPRVVGELRDTNRLPGGAFNFLLANVLSSRMYLKQANTAAQYELERWAEPFSTVAYAFGDPYPSTLLQQAWDYLLQNHPHDSICGCSVDEVHRQMMTRFEWSRGIADQLTSEALHSVAVRIDSSLVPEGEWILHSFNPSERERNDPVTAEIRCSYEQEVPRHIDVYDDQGSLLPSQIIDVSFETRVINHYDTRIRDLSMLTDGLPPEDRGILPGIEYCRKISIIFQPEQNLLPMGYATFVALPNRRRQPAHDRREAVPVLENDYVKAEVQGDGSVRLFDKLGNRWYDNLLVFENSGDIGDGYIYSPPLLDEAFTTKGLAASISMVEFGPVRTKIRIEHGWDLPVSISDNRQTRVREKKRCKLVVDVSLGAKDRMLGVEIRFSNEVRDHRLSVLLPTGLSSDKSWASGSFDIIERNYESSLTEPSYWIEDSTGVFPNHGLVGLTDRSGKWGFAVAPYGLPEAEVRGDGVFRLTLLRAVGYLGAPRLNTIVAGAGPSIETPDSQCIGEHAFRFTLIPYTGTYVEGEVAKRANEFHLPVRTVQMKRHEGILPASGTFLTIKGEDKNRIKFSAFKKLWDGEHLMLRLYNPTDEEANIHILLWKQLKQGFKINLNEEREQELCVSPEGGLELTVQPKKIVTLELIFQKGDQD
jgi:alpha-mannosidase